MKEQVPLGWLFPLRVLLGVILIVDGYQKFAGAAGGWTHGDEMLTTVAGWLAAKKTYGFFVPVLAAVQGHPKLFGTLVTFGELTVGSCYLLGLFSRPAAFLGVVILGSLALASGQGLAPAGPTLLMAAVSLAFLFTAPGRFLGVDQALRGKLPRWIV